MSAVDHSDGKIRAEGDVILRKVESGEPALLDLQEIEGKRALRIRRFGQRLHKVTLTATTSCDPWRKYLVEMILPVRWLPAAEH